METSLAHKLQQSNASGSLGSFGAKNSMKFDHDEIISEIKDSQEEIPDNKQGLSKSESDQFRDQLIEELHQIDKKKDPKEERKESKRIQQRTIDETIEESSLNDELCGKESPEAIKPRPTRELGKNLTYY